MGGKFRVGKARDGTCRISCLFLEGGRQVAYGQSGPWTAPTARKGWGATDLGLASQARLGRAYSAQAFVLHAPLPSDSRWVVLWLALGEHCPPICAKLQTWDSRPRLGWVALAARRAGACRGWGRLSWLPVLPGADRNVRATLLSASGLSALQARSNLAQDGAKRRPRSAPLTLSHRSPKGTARAPCLDRVGPMAQSRSHARWAVRGEAPLEPGGGDVAVRCLAVLLVVVLMVVLGGPEGTRLDDPRDDFVPLLV